MMKKIIHFAFAVLRAVLWFMILNAYRIALIASLSILKAVSILSDSGISFVSRLCEGSGVGVIYGPESPGFNLEPKFTRRQIESMADDLPQEMTINQIAEHHGISFRQARKIRKMMDEPKLNINSYNNAMET